MYKPKGRTATKKRDLEREPSDAGGKFLKSGGNHDIWLAPNGRVVPVPRHREIPNRTAEMIRKEAGLR